MQQHSAILIFAFLVVTSPGLQAQLAPPTPLPATSQANGLQALTPTKEPDVVFVPTPQEVVDKMLETAQLKPGDILYDLGCGDGRIVVTAAKKYGVKAYGFDVDPKRIQESRDNVKLNQVENLVTIQQADIFALDLSGASVVTLYLLPDLNVKLMPQLERMKPGSRIVSHSFDMKGAKPEEVIAVGTHTIYKWTIPLQRESASGSNP